MGKAVALPSVRVSTERTTTTGTSDSIYGGAGDKPHLGGFTDLDHHGVSPATWKWMVTYLGVHSVLDVGCGRGISTSWFHFHQVEVLCVEGSHDAVEKTVLPNRELIVEHDFSRGPWWPEKTYDAIWCVEFLEHVSSAKPARTLYDVLCTPLRTVRIVSLNFGCLIFLTCRYAYCLILPGKVGRNFQKNYITAFRKAAVIIVTHSEWGGHHHVEVHDDAYWIEKFTMFGFTYSETLTQKLRNAATQEKNTCCAPNGVTLNAQHVWLRGQVFINPAVAALPQHAHILAEPGCYDTNENGTVHLECGRSLNGDTTSESVVPETFRAFALTQAQDDAWMAHLKPLVVQKGQDGA